MSRLETFESVSGPLPVFFKNSADRSARPVADRPGWIPAHITENWDPDPYAYMTEEELMPGNGHHGRLAGYIESVVRDHLEAQGLMLLIDVFMLYRDVKNVKQRIDPDLLLMEHCLPEPHSYDLDDSPPPRCVFEITSPDSHVKDLQTNVPFYIGLGVEHYMVIDAITPQGQLRDSVALHLWQKIGVRSWQKLPPDKEGFFLLPEMNLKIGVLGQRLIFVDSATGKVLRDNKQWKAFAAALEEELEAGKQRAEAEKQRAEAERQRAEAEKQRADNAEKQRLEAARQMLADGFAPGMVIKYTGLSAETVAALATESSGA